MCASAVEAVLLATSLEDRKLAAYETFPNRTGILRESLKMQLDLCLVTSCVSLAEGGDGALCCRSTTHGAAADSGNTLESGMGCALSCRSPMNGAAPDFDNDLQSGVGLALSCRSIVDGAAADFDNDLESGIGLALSCRSTVDGAAAELDSGKRLALGCRWTVDDAAELGNALESGMALALSCCSTMGEAAADFGNALESGMGLALSCRSALDDTSAELGNALEGIRLALNSRSTLHCGATGEANVGVWLRIGHGVTAGDGTAKMRLDTARCTEGGHGIAVRGDMTSRAGSGMTALGETTLG